MLGEQMPTEDSKLAGDRNGGNTDLAAAKAVRSDIVEEFARYGLKP